MFDIISTAKNTQWISFPTLCSKSTYPHVANEAVDFQVISGKNCFVEFNKKFGFELLRTVSRDNKDVIQRVKKRQVDDLSCGAISKVCGSEIAIGLTTGFIRIFSVQSGDYMPFKFKPDRIGNSVTGLDYYNTDEYLAAVYDNSDINIFGLKTGVKTNTFRFDGLSTLVRFHPSRKLTLAIGSYEGAITMLDIQAKKKLFFDKTAHDAPIRDISMFDSQDVFATCGYDCNINIFDMRKRSKVQQNKQSHPMSSICVSPCGKFCVAGNLKGEITSFDFRSMKEPLYTKRMHDDAVVRVAFVPSVTSESNMTLGFDQSVMTNTEFSNTSRLTSSTGSTSRQSNIQSTDEVMSEVATPKRRDSWADLMANRRVHDFSMDSVMETPSQASILTDNHSESMLNWQPRTSMEPKKGSDSESIERHEPINQTPKIRTANRSVSLGEKRERPVIEAKRRRMTDIIALEGIVEEVSELEHQETNQNKMWLHNVNHKEFSDGFSAFVRKAFAEGNINSNTNVKGDKISYAGNEEDKENCQNNQQNWEPIRMSKVLLADMPNRQSSSYEFGGQKQDETITVNVRELNDMLGEILEDKMKAVEANYQKQMGKWQENVMKHMGTKLKELASQVRYMQGRYFHSDFNHRYTNHMELESELAMFDEGFAALLHIDTIEDQRPIYAAELEELRRQK